jgi:hypothetical protein
MILNSSLKWFLVFKYKLNPIFLLAMEVVVEFVDPVMDFAII